MLSKLLEILLQHDDFISLEQLSRYGGISRYAIIRLFKKNFGLTPHAFQLNMRVNQARELLKKVKPLFILPMISVLLIKVIFIVYLKV